MEQHNQCVRQFVGDISSIPRTLDTLRAIKGGNGVSNQAE
jgi:hypothetical protein